MPVGVLFFSSDYISYDMTPEQFLDVSWGRLLLLQPGITGRTKSTMRSRQTTKTPAGLASRVDASGQESKNTAGVVVRRTSQRGRHGTAYSYYVSAMARLLPACSASS
jgi:hypothetical protein